VRRIPKEGTSFVKGSHSTRVGVRRIGVLVKGWGDQPTISVKGKAPGGGMNMAVLLKQNGLKTTIAENGKLRLGGRDRREWR